MLRAIAGLARCSEGEVLFEGERIPGPDEKLIPGHPSIAYLSQHFELRNHYHVEELIVMNNHLSSEEASSICRLCRIDHLLDRWTHQLSGGERQRIALACLLVTAPKLLLLDEPYSNLDVIHKSILKKVLDDVSNHLQMTCILVAHEPMDVLPWADEVIVLRQGYMVQKAPPECIYTDPKDEYVAALFGKFNRLPDALKKEFLSLSDSKSQELNSFYRPEVFKVSSVAGMGVRGRVLNSVFMGAYYELEVDINDTGLIVYSATSVEKNDPIYISFK